MHYKMADMDKQIADRVWENYREILKVKQEFSRNSGN